MRHVLEHSCRVCSTKETPSRTMFIRYIWGVVFSGFGATCMTGFEDNEGANDTWHKAQCARRTRRTSTCDDHFLIELVLWRELITRVESEHHSCRL